MLEYILVFGALSIIVLVLLNFVDAARQSAQKTAELVTSDYP